jgi:hypothetical protein
MPSCYPRRWPYSPFGHRRPALHAAAAQPCSFERLQRLFDVHYPGLFRGLEAMLAVFCTLALKGRTKPLSLIFEAVSGAGKSTIVQMAFPVDGSGIAQRVYRSDKFTPKAFVTHAANIPKNKIDEADLLPKLHQKVLLTKELAPIFRGRTDDLTDTFSILISVLDGKGFTSDSGMRGRRGYQRPIVFNWIGATTPLPAQTHRIMAQLGTRLLFYELPPVDIPESQLLAYAKRDDTSQAEVDCQSAVNRFLVQLFQQHPVGSVSPESVFISDKLLEKLVHWAQFLVRARAEIRFDKEYGDWEPIAALLPETPYKVVDYFKEIARGRALVHGRATVDGEDLELVGHIAISSVPGHLRPIVHELRKAECVDTGRCMALCGVSDTTARRYMKELQLLEIVVLLPKGPGQARESNRITLARSFRWLRGMEQ